MSTSQTEHSSPEGSGGSYDALIWLVLAALLGLFAWYKGAPLDAVGRRDTPAKPVAAAPHGPPATPEKGASGRQPRPASVPRNAGAEKDAMERQITEAKQRIAQLEQALAAERVQHEAARKTGHQAEARVLAAQRRLWIKLGALGARETEKGIVFSLGGAALPFPAGEARLPAAASPTLDRLAELLIQYPRLSVRVVGHTDSVGAEGANLALSQGRADAVKRALVTRGVPADRINAIGKGEAEPIADNASEAGRKQNRRIEIYLLEEPR
jgi:outer membrane protein OmpA-like peptidoglycan-associated protein